MPKSAEGLATPPEQINARSVGDLRPAGYNPRFITPEKLAMLKKAMVEFGDLGGIIFNLRTGRLIGGHQRVKNFDPTWTIHKTTQPADATGTVSVGHIETPYGNWSYREVDWSEKKEKAANIAANQHGGEFQDDLLAELMRELFESGLDMDLVGFNDTELKEILGIKDEKQLGPEDPETEPVPDPFVQPGDLWACGPHLLLVGDSTSQADIDRLMGREKADLVWTDPPYNVNYESKAGKIQNDHMGDSAFFQFLVDIFTPMKNALKPGGCFYIAHADSEGRNFRNAIQAVGLQLRQNIVWVKNSPTLSRSDYNWKHEPILYGWKEGGPHYFNGDFTQTTVIDDDIDVSRLDKKGLQKLITELRNAIPTSVIRADKPTKSDLHPTQKPVYLVEKNILASTKQGEIVLDICGGSGTTMIACRKHGRRARLMELDPKYAQAIIQRYHEYCGEEPELIHPDEARQPMHAVKRERKG